MLFLGKGGRTMEELEKINEKVKLMLQEVFDNALKEMLAKLKERCEEVFRENLEKVDWLEKRMEDLEEELKDEIGEKSGEILKESSKGIEKLDKIEEHLNELKRIYENRFLLAIILFSISLLINIIVLIKIFLR